MYAPDEKAVRNKFAFVKRKQTHAILMTFTLVVLIIVENLLQRLRKPIIRKVLLILQKHDQFILIHISNSCWTMSLTISSVMTAFNLFIDGNKYLLSNRKSKDFIIVRVIKQCK